MSDHNNRRSMRTSLLVRDVHENTGPRLDRDHEQLTCHRTDLHANRTPMWPSMTSSSCAEDTKRIHTMHTNT